MDRTAVTPGPETLIDASGAASKSYGATPGSMALVRPDGYIGLWTDDATRLEGYLQFTLGGATSHLQYSRARR